MNYKGTMIAILGLGIISTACRKGCTDPSAENYDERARKDDQSCSYPDDTSYDIPPTYAFTDENGNNTVSYSGQEERLDMLSEMTAYLQSANTAGVAISADTLVMMYENMGYSWIDANGLGMTGSSKNLKSKTAFASANGTPDTGIQAWFETQFDSIAALSATTVAGQENGAPGIGGVWPNDGVKGPYLMNGDGVEYVQFIEKSLMGAVFASQMTVHYLGTLDDDDNTTAVDAAAGQYYTEMEHHWDEAFGYFTSEIDFPTNGTDRFWGKYASGRESVLGSATKIADAFKLGRAAISNDDMTTRDLQIDIIRNEIEKVQGGTAIHYLNSAKANLTNSTARNHVLSEAWAFVNCMKFGHNGIYEVNITQAEIDQILAYIGTDYNNITLTDINNAIDLIASKLDLTSVKDNL